MTTHTAHTAHSHAKEQAHKEPVFDIEKLLERFRLPGVDVSALMDAQRKNVEALRQANEKAYVGTLALWQRQAEIFEETMREWQNAAKEFTSKNAGENLVAKQADFARKAVETGIANMRELAEMAAQSQTEAYEVIGKRVQSSIRELRDYLTKKSS